MNEVDVCADARFILEAVELRNMESPLGVAKVFTERRPVGWVNGFVIWCGRGIASNITNYVVKIMNEADVCTDA